MALLARVNAETLPMSELGRVEDLEVSFHNVNTAQDRYEVEALMAGRWVGPDLGSGGGRGT
jgi:hypothetical protein